MSEFRPHRQPLWRLKCNPAWGAWQLQRKKKEDQAGDTEDEPTQEQCTRPKMKKSEDGEEIQARADDDETTPPPQKKNRAEENQDEQPDKETKEQPVQAKRKKEDVEATQADDAQPTPPPQKKAKSDRQERAVANAYWHSISDETGVKVQTVKKVLDGLKRMATRDLEETGSFLMLGIASFGVRNFMYRQAYTTTVKGTKISVSEKEAHEKLVVKSLLGLTGISD